MSSHLSNGDNAAYDGEGEATTALDDAAAASEVEPGKREYVRRHIETELLKQEAELRRRLRLETADQVCVCLSVCVWALSDILACPFDDRLSAARRVKIAFPLVSSPRF